MTWFKVDDTLHGHPKTRRAGLAAMGMWALGGSYASQYVTDGFVPEWFVLAWPQGKKRAAELVAAGMWEPAVKGDEPGWQFHDWEHFQPSRAEIEADRASNRERQKRWRETRRQAKRNAREQGGNGVSNAVSNGTPSRPVPSRPDPTTTSVGSSVENLTLGSPPELDSPSPNRHSGDVVRRATFGLGGAR